MDDLGAWLQRIHEQDRVALERVGAALPRIEEACRRIAAALAAGGRWFSLGAGTSGRLAALDAAELPPTFGVAPETVVAAVAGGTAALARSIEGAEDDEAAAGRALDAHGVCARDVVLGVAASGTTPYVLGGLRHARRHGATTLALVCAAGSPVEAAADLAIVLDVGPEVLTGSTRMKAGTAQKMALTSLSSGVMFALGRVHRDEMVAMRPTNEKLRARAVRIVAELAPLSAARARDLLEECAWELPVALLRARLGIDAAAARARLAARAGSVAAALQEDA